MLTKTDRRLRGRNMVNMNIHNPLTTSLGWDKLSSDRLSKLTLPTTLLTPSCCLNSRLRKRATLVVSTKRTFRFFLRKMLGTRYGPVGT